MSEFPRKGFHRWCRDEVVDGARLLTDVQYGAVGVFDESGCVRECITPEEPRPLYQPISESATHERVSDARYIARIMRSTSSVKPMSIIG